MLRFEVILILGQFFVKDKTENSMRKWQHIDAENSWTMFKVISEFVEGFEKMNNVGPCVSIFGSARTKPDH
ncbi:MAG: hypothetical protein P8M34_09505, partial [Saprospiraceae bacterium]|nr:hypothetical protein [Saprospiraceae bacterium]